MRLNISDVIIATHRGEERYGEVAQIDEWDVFVYFLVPTVVGFRYSDFCSKINQDNIHEVFPTNGGMYRMEAWLDAGFEYVSHDEVYDQNDLEQDSEGSIIEESDYETE